MAAVLAALSSAPQAFHDVSCPLDGNASLACRPAEVGVRVTRRMVDLATLTENDVLSVRKFPDGVACGTWPAALWDRPHAPTWKPLPEGDWHESRFPTGTRARDHRGPLR